MNTFDNAAMAMCVAMGDDPHREGFGSLPQPYIDGLTAALITIHVAMTNPRSGRVFDRSAASVVQALLNEGRESGTNPHAKR